MRDNRGRSLGAALLLVMMPSAAAVAAAVYGAIGSKYAALGGPSGPLGVVLTDEAPAPHGGRFNNFAAGSIYWHPETGAFGVWGEIGKKWAAVGRVEYGYPITDERSDGPGRYNHFRAVHVAGKPESSIYWTAETGAHTVYGDIRKKWAQMGWTGYGFPITDELATPDGHGRYNHFRAINVGGKPESSIYWTARTGAHAIYGDIRKKWASLGWEHSVCGYPTSDEEDFDDGRDGTTYGYGTGKRFRRSTFTGGQIVWSKARNVVYVECGNQPSGKQPPSGPSGGEACNFTAVAANNQCLNADGTESSLQVGGTTGTGCGSDQGRAQSRAKGVLSQALPLSEGDTPQPGHCTYSLQTTAGCGCR